MARFFPSTLRARVFLLCACLSAAIGAAAIALSWTAFPQSLGRQHEKEIQGALEVAASLIRGLNSDLSGRRLDALIDTRTELTRQSAQLMAFIEAERRQEKAGLIDRASAQRMAIEAARMASSRSGMNVFIFDSDFQGLAHSDPAMAGRSWRGLKGMDGEGALERAVEAARRDGSDTLLLWWPSDAGESGSKHLARIAAFPDWNWFVGLSVDFGRIDAKTMLERNKMVSHVLGSLSQARLGNTGRMFVLEGSGSSALLLPPGVTKQELAYALTQAALAAPGSQARLSRPAPGGDLAVFSLQMPDTGWTLGLVMSQEELPAVKPPQPAWLAAALAATAAAGLAAAWFFSARLTAPLRNLAAQASPGRFPDGPPPGLADTIRSLAARNSGETGAIAGALADALRACEASMAGLREAAESGERQARALADTKTELTHLNAELETRVRLRTAALEAAYARLKSSEARYRGLFEDSPAAFMEMDFSQLAHFLRAPELARIKDMPILPGSESGLAADSLRLTRLLDANPSALQLFGSGSKDRLAEGLHLTAQLGTLPPIARMLCAFGHGARTSSEEVPMRRLDGTVMNLVMCMRPMPGHEESLDRVLVSLQDITAIKQVEERLRAANEQSLAANKAKSGFLANMSHELRTPISAILGLTDISRRTRDTGKIMAHLGMIADSARNLLAIVGDVLDLSKIESGKLVLDEAPFDTRGVVEEAVRPFRLPCEEKGLELAVEIAQDIPGVLVGDAVRLGQVISNLAGNAVKFTQAGRVRLLAAVEERSEDGLTLRFTVVDTGPGIEPGMTEAIFESFRQADSSLSKPHQGAGLGLAICRELTALMGGGIWVESTPGQGSSFHFTAVFRPGDETCLDGFETPLAPGPHDVPSGAPPLPQPESCAPPASWAGRVLIVEDNPVNRHVFTEYLRILGVDAVTAEDGADALRILSAEPVDLVFMDVQMPRMDGVEAVRRIRAGECGERAAGLPVVALTAYAMSGDRQRFLDAGMTGYLAKPIGLETIRDTLALHLPEPSGSPTPEARHDAARAALEPLMAEFLEYVRKRTDEAGEYLARGDMEQAAKAAHDVKGSSMAFGVEKVNKAGARLEAAIKAGAETAAAGALQEVYEALAELELPASPRSMA
ncbi:MAG: response regulator [Thermodesulfobacteriota bacterium]